MYKDIVLLRIGSRGRQGLGENEDASAKEIGRKRFQIWGGKDSLLLLFLNLINK